MTNDELDSLRLSAEQGDADARPPVDTFRYPAPSTAPVTHDGNEAVQISSAGNASTPRQNEYRDMRGNGGSVAYNAFEHERKPSIIDILAMYFMFFKRKVIDESKLTMQRYQQTAGNSLFSIYMKYAFTIRHYVLSLGIYQLFLPIATAVIAWVFIQTVFAEGVSRAFQYWFIFILFCGG